MGSSVTKFWQHSESILTYLDHSTGVSLAARGWCLVTEIEFFDTAIEIQHWLCSDFRVWYSSGPVLYPLVYTLAFIYNLDFTV
jgi:hypothetical protein